MNIQELKLKSSGGLYIGDSIRINIQNISMSEYGDLIQLENIDVDQQVVKIATEKFIEPYESTINQLSLSEDQSRLVKLNDVEFTELGMTYADAVNLSTGSRILSDCNGNTVSVRTSGYANFAGDTVASGKGSVTGIFTIYNSEKQFVIRDINEVQLDSNRCNAGGGGTGGSGGDILYKDFDDGSLTSGGWKTFWSGTNPNIGEWYYEQIELGFNYRMSDLQAALGVSQMDRLDEFVTKRNIIKDRYDSLLKGLPVSKIFTHTDCYSASHLYPIQLDLKKILKSHKQVFSELRLNGVGVNLHYIPVHLQPFYEKKGFRAGDFPNSEKYYNRAITLPMFFSLTEKQQKKIVKILKEIIN